MKKLSLVLLAYTPIAIFSVAAMAWTVTHTAGWLGLLEVGLLGLVALQALQGVAP